MGEDEVKEGTGIDFGFYYFKMFACLYTACVILWIVAINSLIEQSTPIG